MDDAKQLIEEGAQLFKDGKLDEAIGKLKAAVAADPSSVQAHSYLGAAYASDKQHPEAIEQFQAAVDLNPNSAVHTFNLAQAYENAGSKPRAQALYEKALELDPKYARAQQRLQALTGQSFAPPRQTMRSAAPVSAPKPAAPAAPSAPVASAPTAVPGLQPQQSSGPSPYAATQPLGTGGPQYSPPPVQRPPDPSLGLGSPAVFCANTSPSWKRFVAALIDGVITNAVTRLLANAMITATVPTAMQASAPRTIQTGDPTALAPVLATVFGTAFFVSVGFCLLYFVGFNAALGATPGKLILGMRIVKTDGSKIGVGIAMVRYLLQSVFALFTLGLAYIVILVNSEQRGWHDQVAGTMVVDS